MMRLSRLVCLAAASLLAACASLPGHDRRGMVAAANPMAVDAGLQVLRRGGSAVDAAVAVQAVLGLVEPQSSGLGGGAFMTYYDGRSRAVSAYDGRETAPAGAFADMFMIDGRPMDYATAVTSGRSAGAPGAVAMLARAHAEHGVLPWGSLFAEAERLADGGFPLPRRMAEAAASRAPQASAPDVVAYFTRSDGARRQAGETMRNPAYAETLRRLAAQGPKALMEGGIADAIVETLRRPPIPGVMTTSDLAAYRPRKSAALCVAYRVYRVCGPPAPSGGVSVLEGLAILAHTDIGAHRNDAEGWYLFSQASRLAYADRDRYLADPAFVDVPTAGLLDDAYAAGRARLIGPVAGPAPAAGDPRGARPASAGVSLESAGTSHFVVVDARGNAVSMTTSVEGPFGDGRMVAGFFLNNQLTDFSYAPNDGAGARVANAVAPGKRPRSAMSPIVVLDRRGRFVAAVGSPGGPAIIAYNLKALVALLDWKMSAAEAVALPNLIARGDGYVGEVDKFSPEVLAGLAARGVRVAGGGAAEGSGLHVIEATPHGLRGAADPRREGVAAAP